GDPVEDDEGGRERAASAKPPEPGDEPGDGGDQLRQPQGLAEVVGEGRGDGAEAAMPVERGGRLVGAVQRPQRVAGYREVAQRPQDGRGGTEGGEAQASWPVERRGNPQPVRRDEEPRLG